MVYFSFIVILFKFLHWAYLAEYIISGTGFVVNVVIHNKYLSESNLVYLEILSRDISPKRNKAKEMF